MHKYKQGLFETQMPIKKVTLHFIFKNPNVYVGVLIIKLISITDERLENSECFAQYFHAQMAFNLQRFQPASSHTKPWNPDTYVTLNRL